MLKIIWAKLFVRDITQKEKAVATARGEPWVTVVDIGFTEKNNSRVGFMELDWNQAFIDQLIEEGYSGRNDQELMDQWFNAVCRGVIREDNIE